MSYTSFGGRSVLLDTAQRNLSRSIFDSVNKDMFLQSNTNHQCISCNRNSVSRTNQGYTHPSKSRNQNCSIGEVDYK